MKVEEANKIIAEYMGWTTDGLDDGLMLCPESGYREMVRFKESLDSLVPVWEKLGYMTISFHQWKDGKKAIEMFSDNLDLVQDEYCSDWIYAACIATAKAIKELG